MVGVESQQNLKSGITQPTKSALPFNYKNPYA
jgi:hypothetical protein